MSHRFSRVTLAFAVLCVVLAGLNVYQFLDRPKALSDEQIVDRFHTMFYAHKPAWLSTQWLGVRTLQNPNDVWSIQEIITEVKPDLIVETGTAQGGSAALWATILEQVNPDGRVISIDIRPDVAKAQELLVVQRHVEFLTGDSTSPEIIEQVRSRVGNGKVMVILDSDHRAAHVLKEMQLYGAMVCRSGAT
jgi:cephalosporin hydroxylase